MAGPDSDGFCCQSFRPDSGEFGYESHAATALLFPVVSAESHQPRLLSLAGPLVKTPWQSGLRIAVRQCLEQSALPGGPFR